MDGVAFWTSLEILGETICSRGFSANTRFVLSEMLPEARPEALPEVRSEALSEALSPAAAPRAPRLLAWSSSPSTTLAGASARANVRGWLP